MKYCIDSWKGDIPSSKIKPQSTALLEHYSQNKNNFAIAIISKTD